MALFHRKPKEPSDGWVETDDPEIAELEELERLEAAERAEAAQDPQDPAAGPQRDEG